MVSLALKGSCTITVSTQTVSRSESPDELEHVEVVGADDAHEPAVLEDWKVADLVHAHQPFGSGECRVTRDRGHRACGDHVASKDRHQHVLEGVQGRRLTDRSRDAVVLEQ